MADQDEVIFGLLLRRLFVCMNETEKKKLQVRRGPLCIPSLNIIPEET